VEADNWSRGSAPVGPRHAKRRPHAYPPLISKSKSPLSHSNKEEGDEDGEVG
jgi:hypothetical protein